MKKTVLLTFSLLLFTMFSCKKDQITRENVGPVIMDTRFQISLQNTADQDLLNPETQSAYKWEDIKLFRLKEGEKILLSETPAEFIVQDRGIYTLKVIFREKEERVLLQLSNSITDTLTADIETPSYIAQNLKYNGVLQWEQKMGQRDVIIVKK